MSLPKLIQKIINNVGYGQELAGVDNDVVHKTSAETIEGTKRFVSDDFPEPTQNPNTKASQLFLSNPNVTKNVPSDDYVCYSQLVFLDKDGTGIDYSGRLAYIGYRHPYIPQSDPSDTSSRFCALNMACYDYNSDSPSASASLTLGYDQNGMKFLAGPSTSEDRTSGRDLLTRDWIPKDTRIVHTTGDETIDGTKTFTKQVRLSRSISSRTSDGNYMYIHHMGMTKGVLPETQKSFWTLWMDSTDGATNAAGFASRWIGLRTNGETVYRVGVSRNVANNDSWGYLELIQTADGVNYATAPSTPTTGTNTDILTRNWIPKDTRIVHTTGDETITGYKKFQYLAVSIHNGGDIDLISPLYARGQADSKFFSGISFFDKNSETNALFTFHSYGDNGLRPELCWYMKDPLGTNGDVVIRTRRERTSSTTDDSYFHPDPDNTVYLGHGASRWKQLIAATSTISTSDERCKEEISSIDNKILDAWEEIDWLQFKFTDAIEEKGLEKARIHSGLIAQRIDSIFKSHEIDTSKYAFFCYDEWDATPEERDKKGNLLSKAKEAGNRYSIRYEEALCMEAAYNRRRVSRVEERILALEQELAELKNSAA